MGIITTSQRDEARDGACMRWTCHAPQKATLGVTDSLCTVTHSCQLGCKTE